MSCARCTALEAQLRALRSYVSINTYDRIMRAVPDAQTVPMEATPPVPEYPGWTRDMRVLTRGPWAVVPNGLPDPLARWSVWKDGDLYARRDSELNAVCWVANNCHTAKPFTGAVAWADAQGDRNG